MNGNKKVFSNTYIDKVYHYGNLVVMIALIIVIATMTASTVLLLVYGRLDDGGTWYSVFIWSSISGSMWILASAPVYLLSMAMYSRYSGKDAPIKKLFVFLLVAVVAATVFIATAVLLKVWAR